MMDAATARAAWLLEDNPTYPARLMAECGCKIADICAKLNMAEREVWQAILPCIAGSTSLRKQARYFIRSTRRRYHRVAA